MKHCTCDLTARVPGCDCAGETPIFFDRTICATCDVMHERCGECGVALDGCESEQHEPGCPNWE